MPVTEISPAVWPCARCAGSRRRVRHEATIDQIRPGHSGSTKGVMTCTPVRRPAPARTDIARGHAENGPKRGRAAIPRLRYRISKSDRAALGGHSAPPPRSRSAPLFPVAAPTAKRPRPTSSASAGIRQSVGTSNGRKRIITALKHSAKSNLQSREFVKATLRKTTFFGAVLVLQRDQVRPSAAAEAPATG